MSGLCSFGALANKGNGNLDYLEDTTKDNSETKGEEDGSRYIQLEVKEGYTLALH
jgi:hypothetical protein